MSFTSPFKECWDSIVSEDSLPTRLNNMREIGYDEFRAKVMSPEPEFARDITSSLYNGDALLIKGAFSADFMEDLKARTFEHCKNTPSSFSKMVEGCPDFHRKIDAELGQKYSFMMVKHSCYFYHWNDDPLNIWDKVRERWRLIKFLSGQQLNKYENNTPRDGVIDRVQVVRYPSGAGMLETHSDPYLNQRLIISGFMSKRGVDFDSGGFYMIGPEGEKIDLEDRLDVGDLLIAYATVLHGVELIDAGETLDWDKMKGRWFLSLYSNSSDEVSNRHTGYAVKLGASGN